MRSSLAAMFTRMRSLCPHQRFALVRAGYELTLARLRLTFCRPQQIIRDLETAPQAQPPRNSDTVDPATVAWAIGAVARRLPFRADCLVRAMAAGRWLHREGHEIAFNLGVRRGVSGVEAHAWLACDGVVVTGGIGSGYSAFRQFAGVRR